MMRCLKTALRKRSLALFLAFAIPFLAKADLGVTVVTTQNGNEVTADFLVYNFEDIVSTQFTVQWAPGELSFVGVTNFGLPGLANSSFGTQQASNGLLSYAWYDPATLSTTLPNCARIFSIKFDALGGQIPPIVINGAITVVEIININFENITLTQNLGCADAGQIVGNIFNDENDDCLKNGGETGLNDWKVKIEQGGTVFYRSADASGDYVFHGLPGDYEVSLVLPGNNLWTACQPTQTVSIPPSQAVTADFAAQAAIDCQQLEVDLAAPFLRRCFESGYHLHYCNNGTLTAENAYIELELDPYLTAVGSSIPWSSVDGQIYTFPIGNIPVGHCGDFSVTVLVSCDAVLGQAHCSEAHIFPDEICQPLNPLWDGSMLNVVGNCDGDSVRFNINNLGTDMLEPVGFIVIEDDMVNFEGTPFQLGEGESHEVAVPANGSTWRVELDNENTSPYNGTTSVSLEGCGVNGSGTFSLGFVTQFPQGDETPFIDTDCQPNVGSYDPNDKTGYPNGYCTAHFIESDTDLEYLIRFQNTGTDTAFTVVVLDTLPFTLNPATVQLGATSHACDFELLGNGVVQFTFTDIMLPDSNVNESASHGFVNFKVSQANTNANGTLIENQAAIFFDFNAPVYTNVATHTVADDFVQSAGADGDLNLSGHALTWYGVPVEGVEVTLAPTCPVYTDANGYFEFSQLDTADYTLIASKPNTDKQEGVTVLDVLKVRQYIVGQDVFNFPEQSIAADVNHSGSITTFDIVEQSKMAVGSPTGCPSDFWRLFATPSSFPNLSHDVDSISITAIKPGDVIHESMVDSSILKPHFYFKANPVENGQVRVEVKANDFYYLKGFQFGLKWDESKLAFSSLESDTLEITHYNSAQLGELQLLVGVPIELQTLPDSTTLFTLVFDVLGAIGSNALLALDPSLLPFQVVVEDHRLAGATMDDALVGIFTIANEENMGADLAIKISPNPVKSGQQIVLETISDKTQVLTLQIFDAQGRLHEQREQQVQARVSAFRLSPSLAVGLYFLHYADERGKGGVLKLVVY